MTQTIKVLKENLITKLASIKEDNVSIADVTINRRKLLEALKLQKQPDADIITLTYGKVSWEDKFKQGGTRWNPEHWKEDKVDNEPCIQFSCNHTIMRFLNRPKNRYGQEAKVIPLNFVDHTEYTEPELKGIPLDTQELIKALSFVLPCVATETLRPILNCILFGSDKGIIKLVAADGFRLGISKVSADGIPTDKVLIHLTDIHRLLTFLKAIKPTGKGKDKNYPEVYLVHDYKAIKFSTKDGTLELKKQRGVFPDYSKLIPKDGAKTEFIASGMLEAVKALKNIANDGSGIIRLHFSTGKPCGTITLSAKSEEYGESSIECDALVKSDCKIAVDHKYLIDLLKQCGDSRISVRVTVPSSPMLFDISDTRQEVIMPMFVQW